MRMAKRSYFENDQNIQSKQYRKERHTLKSGLDSLLRSFSLSLSFCYFRVDSGSDDDYFIITTIMNRRYVSHTHIESYSLVMFKLRRRWTKKKNTIKPVWMTNRPSASDFLLLSLLFCLSHSRRGTSVLYDCKCKFSKQKRKQKQKYHKIIDYVIKCSGIPCVHFAFTLAVSRALYRHQCLICFVPQSQATLSKKLINILCVCVYFFFIHIE